jgi:NAD(P)-dependent dehydrogenase (short-subunit alcohol dehydrogenase family)
MKAWISIGLLAWTLNSAATEAPATPEPAPNPGTALITGSDRGIGLALTREFAGRGWQVIATCRDPAKATELADFAKDHPAVSIEKLDVTDNAAIDVLAARLKGRPIDALVNNAGVAGSMEGQALARLEPEEFDRVLRVNSYAPLRVSAAFLDLVAGSKQRKIIGISSGYGSVASIEKLDALAYPRLYYYAMSKTALNMGLRQFALDTASRQVTTVLLAPGAVDTDMQKSLRGYAVKSGEPITGPVITPAQSAHSMVVTIEQLKPGQNGKFLSRDGAELPW